MLNQQPQAVDHPSHAHTPNTPQHGMQSTPPPVDPTHSPEMASASRSTCCCRVPAVLRPLSARQAASVSGGYCPTSATNSRSNSSCSTSSSSLLKSPPAPPAAEDEDDADGGCKWSSMRWMSVDLLPVMLSPRALQRSFSSGSFNFLRDSGLSSSALAPPLLLLLRAAAEAMSSWATRDVLVLVLLLKVVGVAGVGSRRGERANKPPRLRRPVCLLLRQLQGCSLPPAAWRLQ